MKPLEPASSRLGLGLLIAAALLAVGIPALRASAFSPPRPSVRTDL